MTVENFYILIGGNYEKIIQNLKDDKRVIRFAKMLLEDTSYRELKSAMDAGDYKAGFAAAHKLKGICQNMYFEEMQKIVHDITEGLRNGADIPTAQTLMPKLEEIYQLTVDGIQELD